MLHFLDLFGVRRLPTLSVEIPGLLQTEFGVGDLELHVVDMLPVIVEFLEFWEGDLV